MPSLKRSDLRERRRGRVCERLSAPFTSSMVAKCLYCRLGPTRHLLHWREGSTALPPMGLWKSEPGDSADVVRVLDIHSLKGEAGMSGLRAVDAILRDAQRLLRALHCIRRLRPVDAVYGQVLPAAEVHRHLELPHCVPLVADAVDAVEVAAAVAGGRDWDVVIAIHVVGCASTRR